MFGQFHSALFPLVPHRSKWHRLAPLQVQFSDQDLFAIKREEKKIQTPKIKRHFQKKALVQHLYLGRNPTLFTEMRVLSQCSDDDHLLEYEDGDEEDLIAF
ncbi:hypothetical protein CRYUN_Cryun23aG0038000 [Craigia yunnanensis]